MGLGKKSARAFSSLGIAALSLASHYRIAQLRMFKFAFNSTFQANRYRQPPQQHVRVQGLQEQDPDFSSQAALRRQTSVPGADGNEHRAQDDGHLSCLVLIMFYFLPHHSNGLA